MTGAGFIRRRWQPQGLPPHGGGQSNKIHRRSRQSNPPMIRPIKPTNDPPNTHHTSVVAGQGGAADSGSPRAGPDSGIQGVRCLSGTLANSPVGYSPREFARRPEAGPARGKSWRSHDRARSSPTRLDRPRRGARRFYPRPLDSRHGTHKGCRYRTGQVPLQVYLRRRLNQPRIQRINPRQGGLRQDMALDSV